MLIIATALSFYSMQVLEHSETNNLLFCMCVYRCVVLAVYLQLSRGLLDKEYITGRTVINCCGDGMCSG